MRGRSSAGGAEAAGQVGVGRILVPREEDCKWERQALKPPWPHSGRESPLKRCRTSEWAEWPTKGHVVNRKEPRITMPVARGKLARKIT